MALEYKIEGSAIISQHMARLQGKRISFRGEYNYLARKEEASGSLDLDPT